MTRAPVQALIVAAGMGTRLRGIAISKPLAQVGGVPLIESAIDSAHKAGVSEFVVVTGYEGDRLEAFLANLSRAGQIINNSIFEPFLIYSIVAVAYFALCYPVSVWSRRLEKHSGYVRTPKAAIS